MTIAKLMKENLQLKEKLENTDIHVPLIDEGVQCDYWTKNGKKLLLFTSTCRLLMHVQYI